MSGKIFRELWRLNVQIQKRTLVCFPWPTLPTACSVQAPTVSIHEQHWCLCGANSVVVGLHPTALSPAPSFLALNASLDRLQESSRPLWLRLEKVVHLAGGSADFDTVVNHQACGCTVQEAQQGGHDQIHTPRQGSQQVDQARVDCAEPPLPSTRCPAAEPVYHRCPPCSSL